MCTVYIFEIWLCDCPIVHLWETVKVRPYPASLSQPSSDVHIWPGHPLTISLTLSCQQLDKPQNSWIRESPLQTHRAHYVEYMERARWIWDESETVEHDERVERLGFVYISYKAYLNMVGGRWKWGTAPSISHENHGEERQIGGKGVSEREQASVLSC